MSKNQKYEPEFKDNIIRLHLEEGRTKKSLTEEYNLGKGTLTYWLQQRRKECQSNPTIQEENDAYEEVKRLRRELAEAKKENDFLKKAAAFFAKEIDQKNTGLLKHITKSLEFAGCCENSNFTQTLITII